jgi:hypothetical protein
MRHLCSYSSCLILCAALMRGASPSASLPSRPVLRFEAQDDQGLHWTVRGAAYQADLTAGSFRLNQPDGSALKVVLAGASTLAHMAGEEQLASRSYYFRGRDPEQWRSDVAHFARLRAAGVYPGIDAVYYWGKNGLETDFVVSPGADASRIKLDFGQRGVVLDSDGNLNDESTGQLLMAAPQAYEIDDEGGRHPVLSRFRLLKKDQAGFETARLDPSRTLIIDPTLSFATYLGGSGRDTLVGIERGVDGRIYVAGNTTSVDLPQGVELNSLLDKPVVLPVEDTFVACYSPDGATLQYVVYVGGNAQDLVTSLAVDPQGRATVAGYTFSEDFPTTSGAMVTALGARSLDAFTYRLSADGSTLEYSTFLAVISPSWGYLATNGNPLAFLVAVDASGAATIGGPAEISAGNGVTVSSVTPTKGAFQRNEAGGNDIFLLRLTPDGSAVQWATYYGGSHDETLKGLTMDSAGNVLVVGTTNSNDLPLSHPFQAAPPTLYNTSAFYNSAVAGFFAKFSSDGTALAAASYFGGQSNGSFLSSVAIDQAGGIYLAGGSPVSAAPGLTDLPATPPQPNYGSGPATLVKLDPTGTAPQYMWAYSFLGAGQTQRVRVDASQRPCILVNISMPVTFPGALPGNTYSNAAFACFAGDGKTLQLETSPPINASLSPSVADFAIGPDGTLIGAANGFPPFPTTPSAPQPSPVPPGGSQDGYVFMIQPDNPSPQLFYASPTVIYVPAGNAPLSIGLSLVGANFVQGSTILWNGSPLSLTTTYQTNITSVAISVTGSVNAPAFAKGDVQIQVSTPGPGGGVSAPFTIQYINPEPRNASITPSAIPTGAGDTTFTIAGSLSSDCTVTWNGVPQSLTLAPSGQSGFQFTMPASTFNSAGDNIVVVSNPPPGGGSSLLHVSVTTTGLPASGPTILGPVVVGVGQGGSTQTLSANNFQPGAVVVWNGSDRPTIPGSNTTLQFVLSLNDVSQMGTAQVQVRSGGLLGPPVTAYIGMPGGGSLILGDSARGQVYFAANNSSSQFQLLVAGAIPSGKILRSVDLGARIANFFRTDDNQYLWVVTTDGRIRRVNIDSFAIDLTPVVPISPSLIGSPVVIPVPGTSGTIIAAGTDGVLRVFDGNAQRGFSTADLFPAPPQPLTPIFATPDAVWATTGYYSSGCMLRLTYDYTGFSSFAQTCNNNLTGPWGLPSPEVKVDAGVTYFQSGSETLVWNAPYTGALVDLINRRMIVTIGRQTGTSPGIYYSTLEVYNLDTEAPIAVVPAAGGLPSGTLAAYSSSQVLIGNAGTVVLVDFSGTP